MEMRELVGMRTVRTMRTMLMRLQRGQVLQRMD